MLFPLLSLVLAAPAPPEQPVDEPKGPPPRIMMLTAEKDGSPTLRVFTTRQVPQERAVQVKVGDRIETRKETVYVPIMEERLVRLDDKGITVYGVDGKKIEPAKLPKLTQPTPVLVSADGKEVDPFYLKIVREGTLIVVAPGLAKAHVGQFPPGPAPVEPSPPPPGK